MPVPQYSTDVPSVPLAPRDDHLGAVTELRVHGVSGTPPGALLADLAPVQVWGDKSAGFYRSAQHKVHDGTAAAGTARDTAASGGSPSGSADVTRNVEAYSWGALTSGNGLRVLWLVLLPFLLGNLSGWMCARRTRDDRGLFFLHRVACGLGCLALTVNAAFVVALITADVAGYQPVRAGVVSNSWWLAPMTWPEIQGHPARQVLTGIVAAALVVLVLHWLVRRSWRYEKVRPPHVDGQDEKEKPRLATAAALKDGLRHKDFWDGGRSVSVLTWLHSGAYTAFLAIVLAVTTHSVTVAEAGSAKVAALSWIAACAGGAVLALSVLYLFADAWAGEREVPVLRGVPAFLAGVSVASLICGGVYAWLQPGLAASHTAVSPDTPVNLPGIAAIFQWTALGLAISVALVAVSAACGLGQWRATFVAAPLACLLLGFGFLNMTLLSLLDWIANLVGPVAATENGATQPIKHWTYTLKSVPGVGAVPVGKPTTTYPVYVPRVAWYGGPMLAWALLAAVVLMLVVGLVCWLRTRWLPTPWWRSSWLRTCWWRTRLGGWMALAYDNGYTGEQAKRETRAGQSGYPAAARWFTSALGERADARNQGWERGVARWLFFGRSARHAASLVWLIVVFQLAIGLLEWKGLFTPTPVVRHAGAVLAQLILPVLMGFIASAWSNTARRREIGIIWDVGTFWPRSFHPFTPPCYAEQAVSDLQSRAWWLHANGGRVVMVAHSQGAILAAAALAQDHRQPPGASTALITFGNPLTRLYAWGFPGYITAKLVLPLIPGEGRRLRYWHNYWYYTDPIGSYPVTPLLKEALLARDAMEAAEPGKGDEVPGDAGVGEDPLTALRNAGEDIDELAKQGAVEAGAYLDMFLLDPAGCGFEYGAVAKGPGTHSGYWSDPRVWNDINQVAAGLAAPGLAAEAPRAGDHAGGLGGPLRRFPRDPGPQDGGSSGLQVGARAPPGDLRDAGVRKHQAVEEPGNLRAVAQYDLHG